MVNPSERMDYFRNQGLEVERGFDEPGTVYDRHYHERTVLYTVSGDLVLTLCNTEPPTVVDLKPGVEFVIDSKVEHSAVVDNDGWGYVAAWDPEEAKVYEGTH